MKLLVERNSCVSHTVQDSLLLARVGLPTVVTTFVALTSVSIANEHVELGNLVGLLAWSWYLDRACPVEITVAQGEGQLLDLDLFQRALIDRHEAMSG